MGSIRDGSLDPRTKFIVLVTSFATLIITWELSFLLLIGLLILLYGYLTGGLGLVIRFWWVLADHHDVSPWLSGRSTSRERPSSSG